MTMPQIDPLAFLAARRKERQKRERESDREYQEEVQRLRTARVTEYVLAQQKPRGEETLGEAVRKRTSREPADVKRRLQPGVPQGHFAEEAKARLVDQQKAGEPGWAGKIWNDLIAMGEVGSMTYHNMMKGKVARHFDPVRPEELKFKTSNTPSSTRWADNFIANLEQVYKEAGVRTDGQGNRLDQSAKWKPSKAEYESALFRNIMPTHTVGAEDRKLMKEAYDRTDMGWGKKGAAEMIFDPINVVPGVVFTKAAKVVVKPVGMLIKGVGNAAADPKVMLQSAEDVVTKMRGGEPKIRPKPSDISPERQLERIKERRQKAWWRTPGNDVLKDVAGSLTGNPNFTFRHLDPPASLADFITATKDKINSFTEYVVRKNNLKEDERGPLGWLFQKVVSNPLKRINPTIPLDLNPTNKLKKGMLAIAHSFWADAQNTGMIASRMVRFHFPKMVHGPEDYLPGGKLYDKLSNASKTAIKHSDPEDSPIITAKDLFFQDERGFVQGVEYVGKHKNMHILQLAQYIFANPEVLGQQLHAVKQAYVKGTLRGSGQYKKVLNTKTGKFVMDGQEVKRFDFVMPKSKQSKEMVKTSVYLNRNQAEYLLHAQDFALEALLVLRMGGITNDVMKNLLELSDDFKQITASIKDVRLGPYSPTGKYIGYDPAVVAERGIPKKKIEIKNLAKDKRTELMKFVSDYWDEMAPGMGDIFPPGTREHGAVYLPQRVIGIMGDYIDDLKKTQAGTGDVLQQKQRHFWGDTVNEKIEKYGFEYMDDLGTTLETLAEASYKFHNNFQLQQKLSALGLGSTKALFQSSQLAKRVAPKVHEQGVAQETWVTKTKDVERRISLHRNTIKNLRAALQRGSIVRYGREVRAETGYLIKRPPERIETIEVTKGKYGREIRVESVEQRDAVFRSTVERQIKSIEEFADEASTGVGDIFEDAVIERMRVTGGKLREVLNESAGIGARIEDILQTHSKPDARVALKKLYEGEHGYKAWMGKAIGKVDEHLRDINDHLKLSRKLKKAAEKGTLRQRMSIQHEILSNEKNLAGDNWLSMWKNYFIDDRLLDDIGKKLDVRVRVNDADNNAMLGLVDKFKGLGWMTNKAAATVSDWLRLAGTGYDFGAQWLHGLPLLGKDPEGWGEMWKHSAKMFTHDYKDRQAVIAGIFHKFENDVREMAAWGVEVNRGTSDYFMALEKWKDPLVAAQKVNAFARAGGTGIGKLKEITFRAQDAFETAVDLEKILMWRAHKGAFGASTDPNKWSNLASLVNNSTGSLNPTRLLIPKSQQRLERAFLFFSSRYTRSSAALVGDILRGGVRGQESRRLLGQLGASMTMGYTAAAIGLNQVPKLDPRPKRMGGDGGDFMTLLIGDSRIGVGGFFMSLTKFVAKFIGENDDPQSRGLQDNPFVRFARSRSSPVTTILADLSVGEDYLGYPLDDAGSWAGWGLKRTTPFWFSNAVEGSLIAAGHNNAASSAGLVGAGFEMFGLQGRPASHDKRNMLRANAAQQEYPELWEKAPGKNITEKWYSLPRTIRRTLTDGFASEDGSRYSDLAELDEELNKNRQLRGKGIDVLVDKFFGDYDSINEDYHEALFQADDKFTKTEYDSTTNMPIRLYPTYDFEDYRNDLSVANKAKRTAKRALFTNDPKSVKYNEEYDAVIEYISEGRDKKMEDLTEPLENLAYLEYLEEVITPPQAANHKWKTEAEARWLDKWGDNFHQYVQETFRQGNKEMNNHPLAVEWERGRYEAFSYYFDDEPVLDKIISNQRNPTEARELWDLYSEYDEAEREIYVLNDEYAGPIVKGILNERDKVRVEFRKRNSELDAFLYRWGVTQAFKNEELLASPWAKPNLRFTLTNIDPVEQGYRNLYLGE